MENPFWDYSLAHYRGDGVEALCLALQDSWDMDVNLLFYAGWLASCGLVLTDEHLDELEQASRSWRTDVVQPLRALRRSLKPIARAQAIRERIAALELEAEQQQQALLYTVHKTANLPCATGNVLGENLRKVASRACPEEAQWRARLQQLETALAVGSGRRDRG